MNDKICCVFRCSTTFPHGGSTWSAPTASTFRSTAATWPSATTSAPPTCIDSSTSEIFNEANIVCTACYSCSSFSNRYYCINDSSNSISLADGVHSQLLPTCYIYECTKLHLCPSYTCTCTLEVITHKDNVLEDDCKVTAEQVWHIWADDERLYSELMDRRNSTSKWSVFFPSAFFAFLTRRALPSFPSLELPAFFLCLTSHFPLVFFPSCFPVSISNCWQDLGDLKAENKPATNDSRLKTVMHSFDSLLFYFWRLPLLFPTVANRFPNRAHLFTARVPSAGHRSAPS